MAQGHVPEAMEAKRVPWRDLDLGAVGGAEPGAANVDKALLLEAGDRGKGGGDIRDGCAIRPRGERGRQLSNGVLDTRCVVTCINRCVWAETIVERLA